MQARTTHLRALRDLLETALRQLPGVLIVAQDVDRVPNTVLFASPMVEGATVLSQLDAQGIAVSAGSACSSGRTQISHVLHAMALEPTLARGAVRVSLGHTSTRADIDLLVGALKTIFDQHAAGEGGKRTKASQ